MKILQIIDSLPATSGGARFVVNLAKSIKNKSLSVDVLLIDGKPSHFLEELYAEEISVITLGENVITRYRPTYVKQISTYLSKYDLVHVHIFPASYIVALASTLRKGSTPIIFTEHGAYNRRATHPVFKLIENKVYKAFDHVIGISPDVKYFIANNLTYPASKVSIIYNGVDKKELENASVSSRHKFGLTENNIIILMAGRFSREKDHSTLIKAFSLLPPNFKLLLAGDGKTLESCKTLATDLKLNSQVKFLGNRQDIYEIIKMSDINVLSSHYEGFGLSIVEAMTVGKPVVGTNVEGMDKVIQGAGLLFEVGDYHKLSEVLFKLGTNQNYYEKIAAKCKERAKQFTLSSMADKYIEIYKKVLYGDL